MFGYYAYIWTDIQDGRGGDSPGARADADACVCVCVSVCVWSGRLRRRQRTPAPVLLLIVRDEWVPNATAVVIVRS